MSYILNMSRSPSSVYHACILNLLFTKLGDPDITRSLLLHIVQHDYYKLLKEVFSKLVRGELIGYIIQANLYAE